MTKTYVIGFLIDNLLSSLSMETKNREYVRKELRKVTKKHYANARRNVKLSTEMFNLTDRCWILAQKDVALRHNDGLKYSTILVMKQLRPYVSSYYKLNEKNWNKLEASCNFKDVHFSSLRVANTFLKIVEQEISHYNYNKK